MKTFIEFLEEKYGDSLDEMTRGKGPNVPIRHNVDTTTYRIGSDVVSDYGNHLPSENEVYAKIQRIKKTRIPEHINAESKVFINQKDPLYANHGIYGLTIKTENGKTSFIRHMKYVKDAHVSNVEFDNMNPYGGNARLPNLSDRQMASHGKYYLPHLASHFQKHIWPHLEAELNKKKQK